MYFLIVHKKNRHNLCTGCQMQSSDTDCEIIPCVDKQKVEYHIALYENKCFTDAPEYEFAIVEGSLIRSFNE